MPAFLKSPRARAPSLLAGGIGLCLALSACISGNDDPPETGAARLVSLLHNPKWYRTFDSAQTISATEGTLLFAWTFRDSLRRADSFYVGIDTLWMLPHNVGGDTSADGDWDLDICVDGLCLGGLEDGIQGANSTVPFGEGVESAPDYTAEHHFQFFPAGRCVPNADEQAPPCRNIAPDSALFGALLYVRSRTGKSKTDTVFGFGAWRLPWDEDYPPPVRPVNGHLPRRSDFTIVNGKVRYTPPNIYSPAVGPEVL